MIWLKRNWGWMLLVIIALLPLINILKNIHIDFSGTGDSWFRMDTITVPGHRPGEVAREMSAAHMAVKETGEWAIRWLVFVLSLTPFTILTGIKSRLSVRQAAGIMAFTFAALHFMFFCIDRSLAETFKEVGFILGLIATIGMAVLAITSNTHSMKALRKNWKRLHKFAYIAAILAIVHLLLLEHADWAPYAIILIVGFVLRLPPIKTVIEQKLRKKTAIA